MPQTPTGVSTPYCTALRLFVYHDAEQCADYLRDGDSPRPTRLAMLDATSDPGAMLLTFGLAACGELESAVLVGKRYQVADLQSLTGSALGRLEKLVADLWFWCLAQRRQPASADPDQIPAAGLALVALDQLRDGERLFGFVQSMQAGLPAVKDPDPTWPAATAEATRMFGSHGPQGRRHPRC